MKIIFLADFLPAPNNTAGGLQNYILRVAQNLHALGMEVLVLCTSKVQEELYPFPIRRVQVSYKEKKLLKLLQSMTFHKIDTSLTLLRDAWAVRRDCRKIPGVDIIQSPNYKFMGLFIDHKKARLVVRASSYRPIWTEETRPSLDTRFISYLENRLFRRADHIIAPSRHLADILRDKVHKEVDVLPTPTPDIFLHEDPEWYNENLFLKKYILYFGTILKRKGLFILAEAMKLVWAKEPDVLLVLAGPDLVVDGKSNYKRFLDIIGAHKNKVIYASNLSQEALFPVIRKSYFTVSPSIEDNCPNSMLEAMALGKVVLGTIGSSMDEFYSPNCVDLLVPRENVQALADKILFLWNLPQEKINYYGEETRKFVDPNHSMVSAIEKLREYYEQILSQTSVVFLENNIE